MAKKTGESILRCSFCGKGQDEVKKLIAGPMVYICDECVGLCNEIIDEELNIQEKGCQRNCQLLWRYIDS